MKYYYKLDSEKRIIFFTTNPDSATASSLGEIELDEGASVVIGQHAIVDGSLVFLGPKPSDVQRYESMSRKSRISDIRHFLASTDYKVIKNQELLAAGLQPEYNPAELHSQRQAWRDELNQLLSELEQLEQ